MLKFSVWLACLTGVILAVTETILNWGGWQWWPFFVIDYISAALIFAGGWATLRKAARGPALLAGGWGVTAGMAWMAFFSVWQDMASHQDKVGLPLYLGLIGLLMASAVIGFLTAIAGMKRGA